MGGGGWGVAVTPSQCFSLVPLDLAKEKKRNYSKS